MEPVVRTVPQTGPKQPAGGIEEAPCCMDWPDSSDSSGEDRLSTSRWEEGNLSRHNETPPNTPSPLPLTSELLIFHLKSHSSPSFYLPSVWRGKLSVFGLELQPISMTSPLTGTVAIWSLSLCDLEIKTNWHDGYYTLSCSGSTQPFF